MWTCWPSKKHIWPPFPWNVRILHDAIWVFVYIMATLYPPRPDKFLAGRVVWVLWLGRVLLYHQLFLWVSHGVVYMFWVVYMQCGCPLDLAFPGGCCYFLSMPR